MIDKINSFILPLTPLVYLFGRYAIQQDNQQGILISNAGEASLPFGKILGYAPGNVAIYCPSDNDHCGLCKKEKKAPHYVNNEFMGVKWECVEFARRYLYQNYGTVFTDILTACDLFSLRFLRHVGSERRLPLHAFGNGSGRKPVPGALLVWADHGIFKHTGHVAVITEVLPNSVYIAEQNVIQDPLPAHQSWTRELPLIQINDTYFIQDTFSDTEILGWMIQTDNDQHCLPLPPLSPHLMAIHSAEIAKRGQFKKRWLNHKDALERAYMQATGRAMYSDEMYHYCTISKSVEQELMRATNELHLMYLHATDVVLKDDTLLVHFDIPKLLWSKIRSSWENQRNQMITGRFDFCLDERGLKVYEYNADSASCHAETGLILSKWAKQANVRCGLNAGRNLTQFLIASWQHSNADPFIHLIRDEDKEENYHTLFMERILKTAGFTTKILKGLDDLHWNSSGQIEDDESRIIHCVWKTWAWGTILDQFQEEKGDLAESGSAGEGVDPMEKVRLIDIMLNPEIHVYEPLWTVIPSNKAILAVLWSLYPNHPYLLESTFELNSHLKKEGYAVKPITGRRGSNIKLVSGDNNILNQTQGKFTHKNSIYQQLWCLPKIDHNYIQICTFTVGGHYGGACLRSDSLLIIKGRSVMRPLRVLEDKKFLK